MMHIDVIEFELVCSEHGAHKTLVPVELPRPSRCAHCFLPLTGRTELRRFSLEGPLPGAVGNEAYVG